MKDKNQLNIVCFLPCEWETYHRRPHITALAKYARVFCIQPPITLDRFFRQPFKAFRSLMKDMRLRKDRDNLYLFTPLAFLSYGISHFLQFPKPINRWILGLLIKPVLQTLGMDDFVEFIFMPQQEYLIGMLHPGLLCYESTDAHAYYQGVSPAASLRIKDSEFKLLKKADVIIASSRRLYETNKAMNPETFFVPNAADVEHFSLAAQPEISIPMDILNLKEPRVGFIGNLNLNIDFRLLAYIAEQHPEWSVVLIGANTDPKSLAGLEEFENMMAHTNIYYLGWRKYETLPGYLKAMDVCLLPYVDNEWMRNVYPNKLHQYLAAGKPVVSSAMPEIAAFSHIVHVAKDQEDFIRLVEAALRETDPNMVKQRIRVASENSVDARAKDKIEIIKRHLAL